MGDGQIKAKGFLGLFGNPAPYFSPGPRCPLAYALLSFHWFPFQLWRSAMALKARQARDSSFILQDTHLPPPPDGSKKSWRSGIAPWELILTFSWGPHSHSLSGGLELKPKDERGDRRENNSWNRDPGSFASLPCYLPFPALPCRGWPKTKSVQRLELYVSLAYPKFSSLQQVRLCGDLHKPPICMSAVPQVCNDTLHSSRSFHSCGAKAGKL